MYSANLYVYLPDLSLSVFDKGYIIDLLGYIIDLLNELLNCNKQWLIVVVQVHSSPVGC